MTVLFLVLALVGLKVLPFYLTVWVLPGLLIPLLQPSEVHALMSMPRFVLVLFPLFIVLGKLIQPTVIRIPWYIVSVTLLVRAHRPVRALVLGVVTRVTGSPGVRVTGRTIPQTP